mgnify:CR=1 FL=1
MLPVIDAIILAAGKSERFGRPKVLQTFLGEPFVTRIITNLREAGVRNVSLVMGYKAGEYIRQLPQSGFPYIVINSNYEKGQFSSLQVGLESVNENADGVIMTLVDCPHLPLKVYKDLVDAACAHPDKVIIPTYQSKGGHPIFLPGILFDEILGSDPDENLRDLLTRHPGLIYRHPVKEPGITMDIDTPEDLVRLEKIYGRSPDKR